MLNRTIRDARLRHRPAFLPMKRLPDTIKQTMRYKRIVASIAEIGIVEPLVVARPIH